MIHGYLLHFKALMSDYKVISFHAFVFSTSNCDFNERNDTIIKLYPRFSRNQEYKIRFIPIEPIMYNQKI